MAIEGTPPSPAVPTKSNSQDGLMFSLRIVNLEYYLSPPLPGMDVCYSKFQGRTVTEVPVVRIYGSTPAGQKACLHLHRVFPYFYVAYDDDLPQDISDALAYVRCLASAIEKAMKLASSNAAKKQHVHSCSLVRARRYYGYYPSEQLFIKIVLYHPQEVSRISTLLLGGGIMNHKFQPHESHIPYLLQLLIDQNLAGMSYIHLSSVKFRRPIPERPSDTMHVIRQLKAEFTSTPQRSQENVTSTDGDANRRTTENKEPCSIETTPPTAEWLGSDREGRSHAHSWVESSIPAHWVWPSHYSTGGPFGRHSTCELEVDASVEDILNRQELVFMPLHEAGPAVKLVQSLTPMWEEERLRTGEDGPAGAAAAFRSSPDRFIPPPSALEQALRDSLFQIVQDEERFQHFESKSDQFLKSTPEMLLECSQAANVVRSDVELQELEPRLDTKSIGVQGWQEDDGGGLSEEPRRSQGSEGELVNEHIIRSQLTSQGRVSQEAEDEVAELLEWMGASQEHDMGASDDEVDEETLEIRRGFSQMWESPTMEAAMLQALSKFEQATQKECQEILDCVNNDDFEEDDGEEDLEAALLEIDLEDVATVQRGRRGTGELPSAIPQVDGASDACEIEASHDLFDRYDEHLNTLNTGGITKDPHDIFGVDEPLDTVQEKFEQHQFLRRIPQNDGADDHETESDFVPEPKRMRLGVHRSTTGSKKDSHDRKEKDIPKRPMWGLLPIVGGSSQPKIVKQEKKEQRVSKQVVPEAELCRNEGNILPRKEATRLAEVAGRGQRMELSTEGKSKGSEVSLRALMRRKRERRLRSKESSISGGSSIAGSQSEGEQSFGGMGIVKSESSLPEDSESQEQQNIALSGLLKLVRVKAEEEVEEMVTPGQDKTLSQDVRQTSKCRVLSLVNRDAEPLARSSQDMKIESGRSTLQRIGTGSIDRAEDIVDESESRSTAQRLERSKLPLKIEDSSVKWDYNLHETGDDRDCGGGNNPSAATGGSMSIQVQNRIPMEEVSLGEGVQFTQSKKLKNTLHSSTPGRAGEIEDKVESENLDLVRAADVRNIKLVEVASSSWAAVVKEIMSAKVTLRNIQPSGSDVNISQDIGVATSQRNACSDLKDVVYLAEGLPSEVFSSQRMDLGSDKVLEHESCFIETQLVDHEIFWILKQHETTSTAAGFATENVEDEFIGTILVEEQEDSVVDLSQADISINAVVVSDKMERSAIEEIEESPPKLVVNGNYDAVPNHEGTEVAGLLFTDMSDVSEDSFDWGDEFGSSHRLDESDEGACASEEENIRARLPDNSSDVKPELSTRSVGAAPALKEPISKHAPPDVLSEVHTNIEFVVEASEVRKSSASIENMNITGVSTTLGGAYSAVTMVGAVLGEEQATKEISKECGEKLKKMSSKSSSRVKHGVGISNLSSEIDNDRYNLLRPTDGQPESTDRNVNLVENEDDNGRESEVVFVNATSGKSECKSSAAELGGYNGQEVDGDILIPVKFYQKPPSRDALMGTLSQHSLREVDYGGVFYGNSKDVPGRATVSAGLIFDVKSREALDLPPFLFGADNKKSRFSISRAEQKTKSTDFRPGMGVPCHYENDGSVSYLLTPARPPPSRLAVQQWLSENLVTETRNHSSTRGERVFTMDANTGKLVPIGESGSNRSTQESLPMRHSGEEDMEYFRPASPKYDEKHVLATPMLANLPASPAYDLSSKRSSRRNSDAGAQGPAGFKSLDPNSPLVSSGATNSVNQNSSDSALEESHVSKAKLLQAGAHDEKNVDFTPPQLAMDEVKKELSKEKPSEGRSSRDIPKSALRWRDVSQITAPPLKGQLTPLSQSGFRDPASVGAGQQITLMSIEVHSETRGNLRPDPRYDAVGMVVVDIQYDDETRGHLNNQTLILLVDAKAASSSKNIDGITGCSIIYLADELLLLKCFVRLVRLCDPDMLVGWEIQGSSLGLLAERAANLGFGLLKELSRTPPKVQTHSSKIDTEGDINPDPNSEESHPKVQELRNSVFGDIVPLETGVQDGVITDEWGRTHGSGLFVGGRIILNLWRIMRGEVKLAIYTLEAVAEAVLRKRVPRIPWRSLTRWFARGPAQGRHRCIKYFVDRAKLNFEIMDQLDLLNRTAELARVFGIDFYSVFSRGSQYRVESMMLRLAHTQNFLLLSPSRPQVAAQPAMECLPLVMEPESRFYTSPVVVLDFQSLYPSMIIAYNLCFSTCLGKIVSNNPKVLGVTNLPIPPGLLRELKDILTITPNGVMYTPPEVRQGVVPRLLSEILSTRIMVKQAMKKLTPDQKVLQRVLNARQFALKLIANVTYGYTAAGFSGRMPCAELADSIVQCGRLTLERAIHLVNTTKRWDARVVYGDTDSMFVHLEGRTREEAFKIGQDIAASVTAMNPNPVTLKMEKVYHPCVLLTKKRYVGYSYESPGQVTPTFDAKGIETIRRDSCAAVAKTLERSLRTLFETQDLSQVKAYLQRQWGKIVSGRVSLRDFIFAKEVRLGTYSARASVLPAAAIVASKAMSLDPRAEPRYAERVPYVVVHGEPGARLSDVVVDPHTMLANGLRLHDTYYITKQIIPALQRVFGLVGADLRQWYAELPRVYRPPTSKRPGKVTSKTEAERGNKGGLIKGTIDHYYLSQHCSVCGELMRGSQLVCSSCSANPQAVVSVLTTQTAQLEKEFKHLEAICRHCGGDDGGPEGHIACVSLDCPIFFERFKVQNELQALSTVSAKCGYYPPCVLDFGSELF